MELHEVAVVQALEPETAGGCDSPRPDGLFLQPALLDQESEHGRDRRVGGRLVGERQLASFVRRRVSEQGAHQRCIHSGCGISSYWCWHGYSSVVRRTMFAETGGGDAAEARREVLELNMRP